MSNTELFYSHQLQRHLETFNRNLEEEALENEIAQTLKAERVIHWKDEQKSQYWIQWWRQKVTSFYISALWHFGCVSACTTLSLIIYRVVLIATCLLGRKTHTGKYLTKMIVVIIVIMVLFFLILIKALPIKMTQRGLLNAYIYNSLVRVLWTPKYKIMILIPAVVAFSSITIYILILQIIGIRLTLIRFNGLKMIPMELTILSSIFLQLPYMFLNKKDTPYHEYLLHILSGEFIGWALCTLIACQLRGKLHDQIARKNVQDTVKIYALQPPPELIQMDII